MQFTTKINEMSLKYTFNALWNKYPHVIELPVIIYFIFLNIILVCQVAK